MKKILFAVIFFLGFGFLVIFTEENEYGVLHKDIVEGSVTVSMDENGFSPSMLAVPLGTRVVFENRDSLDRWPASDSHPSHSAYDGTILQEHCFEEKEKSFDACMRLEPGKNWEFVFEKPGVHVFHDHLTPHYKGTISVKAVLETGTYEVSYFETLKDTYATLVYTKDPRVAILALERDSKVKSEIFSLCHDILHKIGHAAYKKYGNFGTASEYGNGFCNSGYLHGLFESYFESGEISPLSFFEYCSGNGGDSRPFDRFQCYHGVGHGLMYFSQGDLKQALRFCQSGLEREAQKSCMNGVYMEVFNNEVLASEKYYVDARDPRSTCVRFDADKESCYTYIPAYLSLVSKMGFSEIFDECEKVEFGFRHDCVFGVGSEAVKRNMNDLEGVYELCHELPPLSKESCMEGVISTYMNQKGVYVPSDEVCLSARKSEQFSCREISERQKEFFAVEKSFF